MVSAASALQKLEPPPSGCDQLHHRKETMASEFGVLSKWTESARASDASIESPSRQRHENRNRSV